MRSPQQALVWWLGGAPAVIVFFSLLLLQRRLLHRNGGRLLNMQTTYFTDVSDDLARHPKGAESTADQVTNVTDD